MGGEASRGVGDSSAIASDDLSLAGSMHWRARVLLGSLGSGYFEPRSWTVACVCQGGCIVKIDLNELPTQAEFASLVGITQQAVSAMVADHRLPANGTWLELIRAYSSQLRRAAAGRGEEVSELARQKTLLVKAQTEAQDLKNSVARGEYAPIGVLADILSFAGSAVVDRMDQLEGDLRKTCPDLPEEVRVVVLRVLANARNQWITTTQEALEAKLDAEFFESEDADPEQARVNQTGRGEQ